MASWNWGVACYLFPYYVATYHSLWCFAVLQTLQTVSDWLLQATASQLLFFQKFFMHAQPGVNVLCRWVILFVNGVWISILWCHVKMGTSKYSMETTETVIMLLTWASFLISLTSWLSSVMSLLRWLQNLSTYRSLLLIALSTALRNRLTSGRRLYK